MANLLEDLELEKRSGDAVPARYAASLSPDWAVWGPNGGFLAALALNAAMQESRLDRPASLHCHFLAVGEFAPVELQVTSLGGGKRAESLRVDLVQGDALLLSAMVWMVDRGLAGLEHDAAQAPSVSGPAALRGYDELEDDYGDWYPIWRSIRGKPCEWRADPGEPHWHCWLRFAETKIGNEADDALRQVFWLDLPPWNAASAAHAWPPRYLAPNLDLLVHFHQFAPEADWLLARGLAPVSREGVVGTQSTLWTEDGRLLASASAKLTYRRNPGYEEALARAGLEATSS